MSEKRVKISSIINNQLPEFVRSEFPSLSEFLSQYYKSVESDGNAYDLINNIDQYVKVDNITNLINSTILTSDVGYFDTTINVESTAGFSDNYGLIQIDDEIISYEYKTQTTFENCYRGFSGVTSYNASTLDDELTFSTSQISTHSSGSSANNLNSILLAEFFVKLKKQISPGFEGRSFYEELNENLFVKQANNFYSSKGTSESFRILFGALYGSLVDVILPKDYLLEPSSSSYRVTKDIVVESIQGNPLELENKTLYSLDGSKGTITSVEEISVTNTFRDSNFIDDVSDLSSEALTKTYYLLSLDFDYDKDIIAKGSTVGNFKINPKTRLVSRAFSGDTHLDVDSTLGFPSSGSLTINQPNGSVVNVFYTSKTIDQFIGCTGIDQTIDPREEVKDLGYYYSYDNSGEEIRVRITGVISGLNVPDNINLLQSGDIIKSSTLGFSKSNQDPRFTSWFYNISSRYEIESVSFLSDESDYTYEIKTYDKNDFQIGDIFELVDTDYSTGIVQSVRNENTLVIRGQGEILTDADGNFIVSDIRKLISKPSIVNYPELSIYNSNVSNTYYDENNDSVYVTSSSLPNYNNTKIRVTDLSFSVSSFNDDENNNTTEIVLNTSSHSFFTGDLVILKSPNDQVIGFVKRIDNKTIKIAKNKESIISNNYLKFSNFSASSSRVEFFKFNDFNSSTGQHESKLLSSQKLIRKFDRPQNTDFEITTKSGPIGLFANGVEIQNYKSDDYIHYGEIKSIDVSSGGFGYDVINPPTVSIDSPSGSSCVATASVSGELVRIDVINSGFNYLETPQVIITGGNGSGAEAKANLIQYDHVKSVIATPQSISGNQVTFDSAHNFSDFEEVIYEPGGNSVISGLSTSSRYYVKVVGITTIKLYSTQEDFSNDNFIPITAAGNLGEQRFRSKIKKRKVFSVNIVSNGSGYTNRKVVSYASKSGINTATNTINIKNHGFKYGEKITYTPKTTSIGGLSTSTYYVNPIDKDSFRLFEVSNSTNEDFFLKTNQYINLTDNGGEEHIFNYPEISVSLVGKIEIPSGHTEESDFQCSVQPIFRGELKSIFIENGGTGYGNQEIVNYEEQPNITLNSGENADVGFTISDGKITSVFVTNPGTNYNSPPTLVVNGIGKGAILVPIISFGNLVDVKIISGGSGYSQSTTSIDVISAGEEAKLYAKIQSWNILTTKRYPSLVSIFPSLSNGDDGYLIPGNKGGIQYSHFYASRALRTQILSTSYVDGIKTFTSDIVSDQRPLNNILSHSGIIGWAYDGNPIYGPYGYENSDGTGKIKLMRSGYIKNVSSTNRPLAEESGLSSNDGLFLEDYAFNNSGDLDRHNGRFCVTPEFPNGVYAYFATFEDELVNGNRIPMFPYLIGNTYKSNPIEFNYLFDSNQDDIDINSLNLLRNTNPFNEGKSRSTYEYFLNGSEIEIDTKVTSITDGGVENVEIKQSGDNYKVGDKLIFDNSESGGSGATAEVSEVLGKEVTNVGISSIISIQNVELYKLNYTKYVGYSSVPHKIEDETPVNIYSPNESPQFLNVSVSKNKLHLSSDVPSITNTGVSTYINVFGDLTQIKENDIYSIGNERLKVLSKDLELSRLRVLREQDGTSGLTTHTSGKLLVEDPRKVILSYKTNNSYNSEINKELYFNPLESVGVGTIFGVGITSTLYFSNPGVGQTFITIPTKNIYIKNHGLESGDSISYNENGGDSIEVSETGVGSTTLSSFSNLYVTKFTNDTIGISTVQVGLNSLGNYVGLDNSDSSLLFFTGIGTNTYHSFSTVKDNVLTTEFLRNVVTVSTSSTHGIALPSTVNIDIYPKTTKTVVVKYNSANKRFVVDPLSVDSVNLSDNAIRVNSHKFIFGEKVLFEKTSGFSGIDSNGLYYVTPINSNEFKLSTNQYNLNNKNYVTITSTGTGGIVSRINPQISLVQYQKIKFDLSDSSLSYSTGGSTRLPAFRLEFFSDKKFFNKIYPSKFNDNYTLTENGKIGVDSDANVIFETNENTPKTIYYKLTPLLSNSLQYKKELIVDDEQVDYSTINLVKSLYNGIQKVTSITSNTFTYELENYPETNNYNSTESVLSYSTNNSGVSGPIAKINLKNKGFRYKSLPKITVQSDNGINAKLFASSNSIGKIKSHYFDNIGYNYSIDSTISPTASIPSILKLSPLSIFESIEVLDKGFSYFSDSDLVVLDGVTKKLVEDVKLEYIPSENRVSIIQNTGGISNAQPTLIPVSNSNGFKLTNLIFNPIQKSVTVELETQFSSIKDFPFVVGSKILIEGASIHTPEIGIPTKSFNSSEFDYARFEIISNDPNIGGIGATFTYSVADYISDNEIIGLFDKNLSAAQAIPEDYLPLFKSTLKDNKFLKGETVFSSSSVGTVQNWYPNSGSLIVYTSDPFEKDAIIFGQTSGAKSVILSSKQLKSTYSIAESSDRRKTWKDKKGILSDTFQRIHDNDYYQYFSYVLKSEIPYETWNDVVSSTNHTAGFKKFSILDIPSTPTVSSGISTEQNLGFIGAIQNLDSVIDLDCVFNFDLAGENLFKIDNQNLSNQIIFNSRKIQDYKESSGNRVLDIDDISDLFNSRPRSERYTVVNSKTFSDFRYSKYFIYTKDSLFSDKSAFEIVSLIHDDSFTYINQYAKIYSENDLAFFDARVVGSNVELLIYPEEFQFNNYTLSVSSFNLDDTISGIGTLSLGGCVTLDTHTATIPQGSSGITTVVSVESTYRSVKLHTLISDLDNNEFESLEINLVHDGSNVYITEYGNLRTNFESFYGSSGIGSFDASISGSNLIVTFTPNVSAASTYTINSLSIGIGDTTRTGVSTESMLTGYLESGITTITSSPTPSVVSISSFAASDYSSSYYAVSIEDLTNSQYQFSEIVSLFNPTTETSDQVEYGIVNTGSVLGIITTGTLGTGINERVNLFFTPDPNIDYEIRVFKFVFGLPDQYDSIEIETGGTEIQENYGRYTGTQVDIKKSFDLTHNNQPIFQKSFNGSSVSVVDLVEDTILVPYHFFVTGEEIIYNQGGEFGAPIGIATTSIPGIGSTDVLPSTLYAVKLNDLSVRVSGSATDALSNPPVYLDLNSVGVSTDHTFTSQKQNSKSLISIDNVIQSPVVSTAKTALLLSDFTTLDTVITVDNALELNGGNYLKIDNEIVRVIAVNYQNVINDVLVDRQLFGTLLENHTAGSTIREVEANYNIIGNTIYFAEAPAGKVPIANPNDPEEIDYTNITTSSKFSGRIFLRTGFEGTGIEPYDGNYVFDTFSDQFNSNDDTFTLTTDSQNVSGISTNNGICLIRNILQQPARNSVFPIQGSYELTESSGITSMTFTGDPVQADYDVNTSGLPRGGIIVSVGSSLGFGYQPLVSAGGTAIVSGLGTISAVSIGNSGSGYRAGIQTVNVGVTTEISNISYIEFIGTATISGGTIVSVNITNSGSGYTSTNPPKVVFDSPLPYSNLPLIYSSSTPQPGIGTQATVNVVVSQDSSVINFEINNYGYSYKKDDILTVPINGLEGIPTNSSLPFQEFQLSIERTYEDQFAAWHFGKIISIDPIDDLIDGSRRFFPLKIDGKQTSFEAKPGSNLNLANNFIITINDILQVPGESYVFDGGSVIEFIEAPQSYDDRTSRLSNATTSKILFYEGTGGIDVIDVDLLETVKVGDTLRLDSDDQNLKQKSRIVNEIISSDAVRTNNYSGRGVSEDPDLLRNAIWCKQRNDLFLSSASFVGSASSSRGFLVSKARESLNPYIYPSSYLIKDFSSADTELFVDSLKTFFDSFDELGTTQNDYKVIQILNQDNLISCAATAIVSSAGTITSIQINNSGIGYGSTPAVYISPPIGVGTTAIADATLSGSSISTITLTNGGSGYSAELPPSVLIEFPQSSSEIIKNVNYEGDFGIVTGIGTTSIVGVASTGIVFDLFIPENSFIRNYEITGSASTSISGITSGYYFVLRNTNVGYGLTSLDESGQIISVGSTFIDNVYRAAQVSIAQTTVLGVGTTSVLQVVVSVSDYNGLVSLGQTHYYGDYSWGRISNLTRPNSKSFEVYNNGIVGITSSPIVQRYKPLKNSLYNS